MRTLISLALGLAAAGLPISNSLAQERAEDIRKIVREEIRKAIQELRGELDALESDTGKSKKESKKRVDMSRGTLEKARKKLESVGGKLHVLEGNPVEVKAEILHGDHDRAIVLRTGDGDEPHVLRLGGKGKVLELEGGHGGIVLRAGDGDEPQVLHLGGKVLELKGGDGHQRSVRVETKDGKTRVWVNGEEVDADDFEGLPHIELPKIESLHLDAIKGLELDGARVLRLRKRDDDDEDEDDEHEDDDEDGKHRVRRIRIGDGGKTIFGLPGRFSTNFSVGPFGIGKDHTVLFGTPGKAGSGAGGNVVFTAPGRAFNVFRAGGNDGDRQCCCCCGTASQGVTVVAPSAPAKNARKRAAKEKQARKKAKTKNKKKSKGRIMV